MTATFSDLLDQPKDRVRAAIGDTGKVVPFYFSDEAIALRVQNANENEAVATLALLREWERDLIHQPRRESADGASVDYGDRLAQVQALIGAQVQALTPAPARGPRIGILTAGADVLRRLR